MDVLSASESSDARDSSLLILELSKLSGFSQGRFPEVQGETRGELLPGLFSTWGLLLRLNHTTLTSLLTVSGVSYINCSDRHPLPHVSSNVFIHMFSFHGASFTPLVISPKARWQTQHGSSTGIQ